MDAELRQTQQALQKILPALKQPNVRRASDSAAMHEGNVGSTDDVHPHFDVELLRTLGLASSGAGNTQPSLIGMIPRDEFIDAQRKVCVRALSIAFSQHGSQIATLEEQLKSAVEQRASITTRLAVEEERRRTAEEERVRANERLELLAEHKARTSEREKQVAVVVFFLCCC